MPEGRAEAADAGNLGKLVEDIGACRICVEAPIRRPLPHDPNPILQVGRHARIAIFSQAPGIRAHRSSRPFMDPSGVRLRAWLDVDEATFYDADKFIIAPMGFCFPGYDAKGGDLPPRRECAPRWRDTLMARLPRLRLALLVGSYAHAWHLGGLAQASSRETVRRWRNILDATSEPAYLPMPHPSWRNNAWLKANPWFEAELLPELRTRVRAGVS